MKDNRESAARKLWSPSAVSPETRDSNMSSVGKFSFLVGRRSDRSIISDSIHRGVIHTVKGVVHRAIEPSSGVIERVYRRQRSNQRSVGSLSASTGEAALDNSRESTASSRIVVPIFTTEKWMPSGHEGSPI